MARLNLLALAAIVVGVSACTTPAPTYQHLNPSPSDAELSFESDFVLHTHFGVNTTGQVSACDGFKTVGYLLKADSIFLYDKPNTEIRVKVPSGQPVAVGGYHSFADPAARSHCSPPAHIFIPRPGGKYVVKMNVERPEKEKGSKGKDEAYCFVSVEDVGGGERKKVATDILARCTR